MAESESIRVAVVRCDTHAYWFGVFMDEVDPLILAKCTPDSPTRECVHHYFKVLAVPSKLKTERVPGMVITKVYDKLDRAYGGYPVRAQEFSEAFLSHPKVCDSYEELLEDVDAAYIADSSSPGDGADHLELARPFLEKGIPTFVDKPFAATLADAKEMIRLAEENGTVLMSASILAHTDVGKLFRRRFDEIGEVGLLIVKGVGPSNSGVGHGLALAQGLIGYGAEWVECIGSIPQECILLHYPNGLEAFASHRMNDVHDAIEGQVAGVCRWKRDHPHCLLGSQADQDRVGDIESPRWWWTALDFEQPEVMDYLCRIQADVCARYDIDGYECDYFRSPMFFRPNLDFEPATESQAQTMTSLQRRLRNIHVRRSVERGRPLLTAVRVPATEAMCLHIGIEVRNWLAEGLVDLLIVSGGYLPFTEPVAELIALAHEFGVPAYPSMNTPIATRQTDARVEALRGAAANAFGAGADGIQ